MLETARRLAVLSLLVSAGCATAPAGERGWIEMRSANFSIYTTLGEPDARKMLENLELFRAAILVITKVGRVDPHVPTEIYAFGSDADYRPFQPRPDTAGFFRPTLRQNFVVLSGGAQAEQARTILYHEYTHFLMQNEGRVHYPIWFDEGFADLLASIDVHGRTVRIGMPPPHSVGWLVYAAQHGSPLSYSRVIRTRGYDDLGREDLGMLYAQSWLLVHYLTLGTGGDVTPRLRRYVERIEQRATEEEAFREAFGIEVTDLSQRLAQYRRKVPTFGIPREKLAVQFETTVRAVPREEIETRLGWLALSGDATELAQAHFERALAANPIHARAVAGAAEIHVRRREWGDAEAGFARSLELAPEDSRNHLDFAEYFVERARSEESQRVERLAIARDHLARAIELAPHNPEGHAALGVVYGASSESLELGIASLEHALALLPSHPAIEFPLAQLHSRAGHRDRAIELMRRVVYRPHAGANQEALGLLDRLEREGNEPAN